MWKEFLLVGALAACVGACATRDPGSAVAASPDNAMTVAAATDTTDAAAAAANSDDGEPKEVCRTEPVVGSKFVRRICATPAQWKRIEESTAQQMDMMRQASGAASACSGNACR